MLSGPEYLLSPEKRRQDARLARLMLAAGKVATRLNSLWLPDPLDPIFFHPRVSASGETVVVPKITTLNNEETIGLFSKILRATGADELPQAELIIGNKLHLSGTARIMHKDCEEQIIDRVAKCEPDIAELWMANIYPRKRSLVSSHSLNGHFKPFDRHSDHSCVEKAQLDLVDLETVNPYTNLDLLRRLVIGILTGKIKDSSSR